MRTDQPACPNRRTMLTALAGALGATTSQAAAARPVNVVFFLTDDHGAWATGAYGCREFYTPNIDRLAAEGALFSRAYACTPVCSPSRATYITGKMPSGHGVHDAMVADDCWGPKKRRLLDSHITYSELLAKAGYTLGMCGKWHMGDDGNAQAGFSYWCTKAEKGSTYKNSTLVKNGAAVQIDGFLTDACTDAGLEFIEANKQRPFFLYMPFHAPHQPFNYQPERDRKWYADSTFPCFPEAGKNPQRRRNFENLHGNREAKTSYAALVSGVDFSVGRIVRRLEELGLRENTLIVFAADQGWNAGHHGVWGKGNATIPFNMYEESIKIPLIWNHPGKIQKGTTIPAMVSNYDFFPAILEYLGVPAPPPDAARLGRSYAPFLRGEKPEWRTELYFEYCYTRAVRTENLKYIERAENWPAEFYDLELNPAEDINMIGVRANHKRLNALRTRLRSAFEASGAPPIEKWHDSVRNVLTIDIGYYDKWLELPLKKAGTKE
ncbi:MAG TPA: sulfatase-like hydrolase/transferase [Bryobacteraceae bacterium]|nr:sulfatase-like hydrolase/transferase [Bryobacteraceae bacterium]